MVLGLLPFFFVFDLPGRRRTLNLQTYCLAGVACRCVATPAESTTVGHPRVGLACCLARCHVMSSRLSFSAFSLCGLLGCPSRSQHGHRCCNNSVVQPFLLVLRLKSFASTPYCAIASNTFLVVDLSSGACFSAQLIIILLIKGDFPAHALHHCRRFWPTRALASSQLEPGIAPPLPPLLRSHSLSYVASLLILGLLRGPRAPQERFRASSRPSRSSLCVKPRSYLPA